MSSYDEMLERFEQYKARIDEEIKTARDSREAAQTAIEKTYQDEARALDAEIKLNEAMRMAEEAQTKVKEAEAAQTEAEKKFEELDSDKQEAQEENTGSRKYTGKGVGALVLAAIVLGGIGGYILSKRSYTGTVTDANTKKAAADLKDTPATLSGTNNGVTTEYDPETNTAVVKTEKVEFPVIEEEEPEEESVKEEAVIEEEIEVYEDLTTEKFEDTVAELTKTLEDKGINNIKTKDVVKYVAIANIDKLVEDNPELASELFTVQSREEYLNDAAKFVGSSVMYGFTKWNETHSTADFIRISDVIVGDQKDWMLKIEDYTDKIADAVNENNTDKVNEIVSEFLTDMNSGELSKLDDGVGFAAQTYIALISDGIAKDHLNKQNFDMFQILKTSEKYVSNIFTVYSRCNSDTKTLTK